MKKNLLALAYLLILSIVICETTEKSEENMTESVKKNEYSTKYDNIDLEEVLKSDRLLLGYVNCLLEKGKCTPDGAELKQNLPDAINNDCKKCSEKQKIGSERVMHFIIDNKPEWWKELETKYNPDGTYKKAYLERKANSEQENCDEDKKQ